MRRRGLVPTGEPKSNSEFTERIFQCRRTSTHWVFPLRTTFVDVTTVDVMQLTGHFATSSLGLSMDSTHTGGILVELLAIRAPKVQVVRSFGFNLRHNSASLCFGLSVATKRTWPSSSSPERVGLAPSGLCASHPLVPGELERVGIMGPLCDSSLSVRSRVYQGAHSQANTCLQPGMSHVCRWEECRRCARLS